MERRNIEQFRARRDKILEYAAACCGDWNFEELPFIGRMYIVCRFSLQCIFFEEESMPQEVKTINLWETNFLLKASGGVNCYLINTDSGYILIDTGFHSRRNELVKALESAGCKPGNLKLIIITHADLDHIGNCAYLWEKYATKVAIHPAESEAVQSGNMAANRKTSPGIMAGLLFSFVSLITMSDRFKPDVLIEERDDLSAYGFDAKVLELPGHSRGSIGILTADGDLFCGDLLWNIGKPAPTDLVDDSADLQASIEKVKGLQINTVYPGHGEPFTMELFLNN